MKKWMCLAGFLGVLSLPAYADFQCDFDLEVMGHKYATWIQLENLNGQETLVCREAGSKEGETEGVIFVATVTGKEKTPIGSLVRAEVTENGDTTKMTIVLPEVLPGQGRLDWSDNPNENVVLKECRRK